MNGSEINIVVGTTGHTNHGKTTLIKALTGIDTDRLKIEKERGMTIEPSFTNLHLPAGNVVSIVDVPGHEKFIKNMIRGITGIDIAILVVAADDGVMPQTREHLEILKILNIHHGIIVISKIDLVDDELIDMAMDEVRVLVRQTFLEGALIIPFSAKTGRGLGKIHRALENVSKNVAKKDQDGVFRLPIDRVFSMDGHGTIVTGTIISGMVRKGDIIEIYPHDTMTYVRNIQIHNQWVDEAVAGHRVGLNLSDVRVEELEKGMVLGEPKSLAPAHIFNARLQYLPSNSYHLNKKTEVKLFSGTYEVNARVNLINKEQLLPGESCFAQFRLENKIAPLPYDRYVIRTLNPVSTAGGGVILEINPVEYGFAEAVSIDHLELLERRITHEIVEAFIRREGPGPLKFSELVMKLHFTQPEIERVCEHLINEGRVLLVTNDSVTHREFNDYLEKEILEKISAFHGSHPDQKDASQEAIRSKISPPINQRLYESVLEKLKNNGKIDICKGRIRLIGFQVTLSKKQKQIYDRLDEICKSYHFRSFPSDVLQTIKDCYGENEVEGVLKLMIGERRMIRLSNHRLVHAEAVEDFKKILRDHVEKKGRIALKDSMEVFGVGRTQVQPIFDYLDSIRFTMRVGDYRVLHKIEETKYA